MKKFGFKLLVLALPFLLVTAYIEKRLGSIPNSYNTKRKFLENQLDKIQVLQLGNSHIIYGVNPGFFSYYGFNLANVSQTIYYDTRLAEMYLDRMPSLKLIILPISYETFRDNLKGSSEFWREYYYKTFWGVSSPDISYFSAERYSKIALYNINTVKQFAQKGFNINLVPELKYNGFDKNDSAGKFQRITDSIGKERMAFLKRVTSAGYIAGNVRDLEQLLEMAAQRHIKVVFITTPVFETYSKYADAAILAENDSLVHLLNNKYHSSWYNYFCDKRFTINDFADNDHLSYVGAEKLSRIMDSEIIRPEMERLTGKGQ